MSSDSGKHLHIGSEIDDYGFHPDDFRILCRISRRRECSESVKNIAQACFMSDRQVRYAIHTLTACGIISQEERIGTTAVLQVRPVEEWTPCEEYPAIRSAILRGDPAKKPLHKGKEDPEQTPATDAEGTAPDAGLHLMQGGLQEVQEGLQPVQGGTAPDAAKGNPIKVIPLRQSKKASAAAQGDRSAKEKKQNIFYDIFTAQFFELYGANYQDKKGDFIQLAYLKTAQGELLTESDWNVAVQNYFKSPRGVHTLADLCVNYAAFHRSALDRFNQPTVAMRKAREAVIPG